MKNIIIKTIRTIQDIGSALIIIGLVIKLDRLKKQTDKNLI